MQNRDPGASNEEIDHAINIAAESGLEKDKMLQYRDFPFSSPVTSPTFMATRCAEPLQTKSNQTSIISTSYLPSQQTLTMP